MKPKIDEQWVTYSNYYVTCDCCGRKYVYESSPMIKDKLWESISNEHWEGDNWVSELFCLDCMEQKLGRKIKVRDLGRYRDTPHNQTFLARFYKSR